MQKSTRNGKNFAEMRVLEHEAGAFTMAALSMMAA
jgi:hypothetical protein